MLAARLHDALIEDDDARACRDLDDRACRVVPGNFFRQGAAQALTKLGDALVSPKATLPWLLALLQAPAWIASVLVPVRESGALLPQMLIGAWVRGRAIRKWIWVAAALGQALAVAGLVLIALTLSGLPGGLAVLAATVVFSLARGFASVAGKDVLAKTVPRGQRGQAGGLAATLAGAGTLAFAALLLLADGERPYLLLLPAGAALWLLAAWAYARIDEYPGATEGGVDGLAALRARAREVLRAPGFARFIWVRSLMIGSALMAPMIVLLMPAHSGASLGRLLLAQGAAALLSGMFWGRLADRSSRQVLIGTALATALLGALLAAAAIAAAPLLEQTWLLPGAFFVLNVIHDGVRAGRKTYIVDLAQGNQRTDFVSISNSIIGLVLLLAAGLSALASSLSVAIAIGLYAGAALLAALLATGLPEARAAAG